MMLTPNPPKRKSRMKKCILIVLLLTLNLYVFGQRLYPDQIVYEAASTGADKLFDGNTGTYWFPGWKSYPHTIVLRWKSDVKISKIRIYDGTGKPTLTVKVGTNTPLNFKLEKYQVWVEQAIEPTTTREITVTLSGPEGDKCIGELEIIGEVVGGIDPKPEPCDTIKVFVEKIVHDTIYITKVEPKDSVIINPPQPPAGNSEYFAGTNCFTWTPLEKLDTIGSIRAYIASYFITAKGGLHVEPIFQSRTDDNKGLDTWMSNCRDRGIEPVLCINQTPSWFNAVGGSNDPDRAPCAVGFSRTDPNGYKWFAGFLGQVAKRYGSKKWDDSKLVVDPIVRWNGDLQIKKSGLNQLKWIEVWNEPDKWWKKDGSGSYMEPEEYAAMLSICYDSIKASDPNMMVVMAGLTTFDLVYLNRMDVWFKANRADGKFPSDVINLHQYASTPNFEFGVPVGESPDYLKLKDVVAFAKARGKFCWVSEFGYDSQAPSWVYAKPRDGKTSEQLQGEWMVETFRFMKNAGVDRAYVFTGNDESCAPTGGTFCSSGLLYGENLGTKTFQPKPAYFEFLKLKAEKGY